ncbi:hypothetical protein [Streptomyces flavidovirens]|uniref:hypothetical protein n=1 Tax=Streptomyces flavidovirens TaxID=67298 RepID=UPI0036CF30BA
MSDYPEIAKHFESDTPNHTLTAHREDGPFRYLRFAAPKTSMTVIELVTWPHNLVVAGSHGSFHFAHYADDRQDMFTAFRGRGKGRVDPDHWARMLVNGRESVAKYDRSLLEKRVREATVEGIREGYAPRGVGKAVTEEVLDSGCLDQEATAVQVVSEFQFGVKTRSECSCGATDDDARPMDKGVMWKIKHEREFGKKHQARTRQLEGFDFDDISEWNIHGLDYHYVWQCHAIVWGIGQYDAARKAAEVAA